MTKKEATKESKIDADPIEALKAQLKDFSEKAELYKTMMFKAQGAIEVLEALKKEKEEGEEK